MAFRLRVGECWARRIVEIEEREERKEADITPGPFTKRRKVVQHPLPEARKGYAFAPVCAVCSKQSLPVQRVQIPHKN